VSGAGEKFAGASSDTFHCQSAIIIFGLRADVPCNEKLVQIHTQTQRDCRTSGSLASLARCVHKQERPRGVECEGRKSMLARRQLMIHHQGPNIPAAARRCRPPCLYRGQQCYYGVPERERRKIVLNHLARQSNIHSFQLARAAG
jgi:hypothetical protein